MLGDDEGVVVTAAAMGAAGEVIGATKFADAVKVCAIAYGEDTHGAHEIDSAPRSMAVEIENPEGAVDGFVSGKYVGHGQAGIEATTVAEEIEAEVIAAVAAATGLDEVAPMIGEAGQIPLARIGDGQPEKVAGTRAFALVKCCHAGGDDLQIGRMDGAGINDRAGH